MKVPPVVLRMTGALAVLAAGAGLWAGQKRASLTETDVILAAARTHVETRGGRLEDCAAVPGRAAQVWIIVRCGRDGAVFEYHMDRYGRRVLTPTEGPQA